MGDQSLDSLLDLVALTYEVGSSGDDWDRLLVAIAQVLDATASVFYVHDLRRPGLGFARLWGRPEVALEQYDSHFAAVDVAVDTMLERPPMSVMTDEDVPSALWRKSEVLNDFRRPWDTVHFVCGDPFRDSRRIGMLAVQGSRDRGAFDAAERDLIGRLLPHLARAVQMRAQFEGLQKRQTMFEDLIEGLAMRVVVLDERAAVIHANAAARRIVGKRDGLTIADRRLRTASRAEDAALARTIAAALDTTRKAGLDGGGTLRVTRPSGERSWSLLVCAGPGADSHSPFRAASAIVLIGDPDSRMESAPRAGGAPLRAHRCAIPHRLCDRFGRVDRDLRRSARDRRIDGALDVEAGTGQDRRGPSGGSRAHAAHGTRGAGDASVGLRSVHLPAAGGVRHARVRLSSAARGDASSAGRGSGRSRDRW